ncbi:MAG: GTP 3',8-cyclase MoaA [Anaerolineales bacterium]|nr:GTP 3',8-cyclase MoaA [Anaerolineales bacterium]
MRFFRDQFGRPLRDLRISVTDRCNFRCVYCMPKAVFGPKHAFLPKSELLTFEEITRLARIFVAHGVQKIRLTGGEPLLRHNILQLVGMLAPLGELDLTMTTNGSLLKGKARDLKRAGLNRVTISLDSLDDDIFQAMNDVGVPVERVLAAIDEAIRAELIPLKINMVVRRGLNDASILPMAEYFRGKRQILRFIEYMDVGSTNHWEMKDVVPASEIIARVNAEYPLEAIDPNYSGEVARRYRYKDEGGEIGVISSVTQPFCGDCSRIRLSADGTLFTCLFATSGIDLKSLVRSDIDDEEIVTLLERIWAERRDRYSEERLAIKPSGNKVEMSYIGG